MLRLVSKNSLGLLDAQKTAVLRCCGLVRNSREVESHKFRVGHAHNGVLDNVTTASGNGSILVIRRNHTLLAMRKG